MFGVPLRFVKLSNGNYEVQLFVFLGVTNELAKNLYVFKGTDLIPVSGLRSPQTNPIENVVQLPPNGQKIKPTTNMLPQTLLQNYEFNILRDNAF